MHRGRRARANRESAGTGPTDGWSGLPLALPARASARSIERMHARGVLAIQTFAAESPARVRALVRPFFPSATVAAIERLVAAFRADVSEPILAHRRAADIDRGLSERWAVGASILRTLDELATEVPRAALATARHDSLVQLHSRLSARASASGRVVAELWEEAIQGYRAAVGSLERSITIAPQRAPIELVGSYIAASGGLDDATAWLMISTMGLDGASPVASRPTLVEVLGRASAWARAAYSSATAFAADVERIAGRRAGERVRDVPVSVETLDLLRAGERAWVTKAAA